MPTTKADIIAHLQKDVLSFQGFKTISNNVVGNAELGPIKDAFPNAVFPLSAVHEFFYTCPEEAAATSGFITGVLGSLIRKDAPIIWISSCRTIFPPALKSFGIEPDNVIFIDLKKEKEILWALEEAIKCDSLAAVIGETTELSFLASRRLQLAVEQSKVTGFILRCNARAINITACFTRWKITQLSSKLSNNMPGIGFPRWNVELLKVRNGKPGSWQVEWAAGRFRHIPGMGQMMEEQHKKTG